MWGLAVLPGKEDAGRELAACCADAAPYLPLSAGAAGKESVGDEGPAVIVRAV